MANIIQSQIYNNKWPHAASARADRGWNLAPLHW